MKRSSKLACLLGLGLLGGLCMLASVSATDDNWISIDLSNFQDLTTSHKSRLIKLYLLNEGSDDSSSAYISATQNTLDVFNGFIVDETIIPDNVNSNLVMVWWWRLNTIWPNTNFAGIAWWEQNQVSANNAAIGGGQSNVVSSVGGVVAWGKWNLSKGWVVLWWQNNTWYVQWVVLWWKSNEAGENGLAMWQW